MDKQQENLLRRANDARLVHMNEQLVYPILDLKVEEALAQLCLDFKMNGSVSISKVAYMAACRDLKIELEAVARTGDHAAVKLNLNPPI